MSLSEAHTPFTINWDHLPHSISQSVLAVGKAKLFPQKKCVCYTLPPFQFSAEPKMPLSTTHDSSTQDGFLPGVHVNTCLKAHLLTQLQKASKDRVAIAILYREGAMSDRWKTELPPAPYPTIIHSPEPIIFKEYLDTFEKLATDNKEDQEQLWTQNKPAVGEASVCQEVTALQFYWASSLKS